MASPQMEDGFVGVARVLFERLYQSGISQRELVAMLCLIRHSYGYRQKYTVFGAAILSENTGMNIRDARKVIGKLKDRKMITCMQETFGPRPGIYGINKDWEAWKLDQECAWPPLATRGEKHRVSSDATRGESPRVGSEKSIATRGEKHLLTRGEKHRVTRGESPRVDPPTIPSRKASQGGRIHERHERHDPSLRSGGVGGVGESCMVQIRKLDPSELNFRNKKKLRDFLNLDLPGPQLVRLLTEAVDRTQHEARWDWPVSVAFSYANAAAAKLLNKSTPHEPEEDRNVVYTDD